MSQVHAIMFNRLHYTTEQARAWLHKHEYKPIKRVDVTTNYLRYRIKPPNKKYNYNTINFGNNIKAVIYH